MAGISAEQVKSLRDRTGAGMMDCKKALAEAEGDVEKAFEVLRERGLAKAAKRAGRATSEGAIAVECKGAAGGIVELGCETDFVAKTPDFQELAGRLATAVAGSAELADPDALAGGTIDGDSVRERIDQTVGKLGENIVIKRCEHLAVGGAGTVGGYVHAGGKLGVIVGLATEASGDEVERLAKDLAMHVAAADPSPAAVTRDGVPEGLVEKERELFRRQAEQEGKPEKVIERIVEGRIKKYYSEVCLLEQPFVKDPDQSVQKLLEEAGERWGQPVEVTGFVRYRLGETSEA